MVKEKTLVWLSGEIKTLPFGEKARKEAGFFLRIAQKGIRLSNPPFDPMPEIGKSCSDLHDLMARRCALPRFQYQPTSFLLLNQ